MGNLGPDPARRAPSLPMTNRHFQDEEFPEHCDHCPREFSPGTEYQRVQFVVDGETSVVGRKRPSMVEHSFELVLCVPCAGRLNAWLRSPLEVVLADGEEVDELDDGELESELEKELFILSAAERSGGSVTLTKAPIEPDVSKWRNASGVPIFPTRQEVLRLRQKSDIDAEIVALVRGYIGQTGNRPTEVEWRRCCFRLIELCREGTHPCAEEPSV